MMKKLLLIALLLSLLKPETAGVVQSGSPQGTALDRALARLWSEPGRLVTPAQAPGDRMGPVEALTAAEDRRGPLQPWPWSEPAAGMFEESRAVPAQPQIVVALPQRVDRRPMPRQGHRIPVASRIGRKPPTRLVIGA